ncbi:arginine--tRNA ligase [Candidatus Uhrbacteria bacterium]|nr:arginine--tRNA ligase [Candidatus Uhrbacteria bacterium]
MNTWEAILSHVARRLSEAAGGVPVQTSEVVIPPTADVGDLAFGCFKLAKILKKNPAELATQLAETLTGTDVTIASAVAAGPYVNFRLHLPSLMQRVTAEALLQGEAYGQNDLRTSETILFEYANPNTHKEIHVGHLRNFILGASLVRILRRSGATVIPVSYINDIGTHVAKCLWQLVTSRGISVVRFGMEQVHTVIDAVPLEKHTARYLGQIYADATKALEEKSEEKMAQVSAVHAALERHDPAWEMLWRETKRWCMDEMVHIFDELGVRIERQFFDSECVDRAHVILNQLETKGIAKMSQGALVIDMETEKLGFMLLRKSDGSLLYAAKDLALAEMKLHEYPHLDQSLVLVDVRQALNFRQLAEALKRMGIHQTFGYLGYELVTLPDGTMSSRKGNIITFHTFRDTVNEQAKTTTAQRHPDWNEGKVEYTAWCLAQAGMKYGMLKQDPEKIITFDIQAALAFDGDTGPYIQYAVTRLGSILKKAKVKDYLQSDLDFSGLNERAERALLLRVAHFSDICQRASREMKPSIISQWCFALAQDVHAFYRDIPVLDAAFGVKQARLQLVILARLTLIQGLDLLGIAVPEEM